MTRFVLGRWTTGVRIVAGTFLGVAGLAHLMNGYHFAQAVASYRLLPADWSILVAAIVPFVELTIAVCFVARLAVSAAGWIAGILFSLIAIVQIVTLLRGLQVACGCWGYSSQPVSVLTAGEALVGALIFVLIAWKARNVQRT